VAAINGHHYAGRGGFDGRNTGKSHASFVGGSGGTARDTLTIVSVSREVVTIRLAARQADGTIFTYQGTHTVHHGAIVGSCVLQTG